MPTGISYVDETWNPVVGCTKRSPGCENCYAEKMAYRLFRMGQKKYKEVLICRYVRPPVHKYKWTWNGKVFCDEKALEIPLHWRQPRRILVPSMGDLFHKDVPFEYIDKVYAVASMCPQHTLLLLTKRIEIAAQYYDQNVNDMAGHIHWVANQIHDWHGDEIWPLPNIHLGVTICNQAEADEKIPILLQIPAAHRWLSIEPMLEEIDLPTTECDFYDHVQGSSTMAQWKCPKCGKRCCCNVVPKCLCFDGVVVGCESGPKRRSCKLEHIRSIVQQCKAAGVGCYVKQVPMPWCGKEYRGQWAGMPTIEELDETNKMKNYVSHDPAEWPEDLRVQEKPGKDV